MGTINLMDSCYEISNLKSLIVVTSDKCYENSDQNKKFTEKDKLGGDDPYSASKAACEIVVNSYTKSFFKNIGVATARSGNVIGGGDNADNRLIPDVINSLLYKKDLVIRNPNSTRPWQHVFEALNGYILLAEKLTKNKKKYSGAWNFGPNKVGMSVRNIVNLFSEIWGSKINLKKSKLKYLKEKKYLSLNSQKANKHLKWKNKWDINKSISQIIEWHKHAHNNNNVSEISLSQIINYINH